MTNIDIFKTNKANYKIQKNKVTKYHVRVLKKLESSCITPRVQRVTCQTHSLYILSNPRQEKLYHPSTVQRGGESIIVVRPADTRGGVIEGKASETYTGDDA